MDIVQLYMDNQMLLNLLIGAALVYVAQRYYFKGTLHKLRTLIDVLDGSLEDDNVTLEEQKMIIECMRDLLGENVISILRAKLKI